MAYQALARKWRPRSFQDVVGQAPTLRILTHALETDRLHHAYLFTGTRGVGKTTLARILAKCLNCEAKVTANPCGTCQHCRAIDAGQFLDLYEIDAASRTKVEDTRDLLENVAYPPTMGRYKIYLIDEVHMLSQHSFNALLKTLEEPPAHVKFLLATTDPKRLPITILSRCLQFHLKHLSIETMATRLGVVVTQEKIAYEENALQLLAKAANGSMRDALSLLDQAIAFGAGSVNTLDVNNMLGNVMQSDMLPLLEALAKEDGTLLLTALTNLLDQTSEAASILDETINVLHAIAFAQIIPSPQDNPALQALTKQFSPEAVQIYYQIALLGKRDLELALTPKQGIEMIFLRMLAFTLQSADEKSVTTPSTRERITAPSTPARTSSAQKITEPVNALAAASPPPPKQHAHQDDSSLNWRQTVEALGLSGVAQLIVANCILTSHAHDKIQLTLAKQHATMLNDKLKERIQTALATHFGKAITLTITVSETELMTPAKEMANEKTAERLEITKRISKHPLIKHFLDRYDTTLDITMI